MCVRARVCVFACVMLKFVQPCHELETCTRQSHAQPRPASLGALSLSVSHSLFWHLEPHHMHSLSRLGSPANPAAVLARMPAEAPPLSFCRRHRGGSRSQGALAPSLEQEEKKPFHKYQRIAVGRVINERTELRPLKLDGSSWTRHAAGGHGRRRAQNCR